MFDILRVTNKYHHNSLRNPLVVSFSISPVMKVGNVLFTIRAIIFEHNYRTKVNGLKRNVIIYEDCDTCSWVLWKGMNK
jgi:hypothetical protein